MIRTLPSRRLLARACSIVLLGASVASAQYQVGGNGRLNEVNTQIGGGAGTSSNAGLAGGAQAIPTAALQSRFVANAIPPGMMSTADSGAVSRGMAPQQQQGVAPLPPMGGQINSTPIVNRPVDYGSSGDMDIMSQLRARLPRPGELILPGAVDSRVNTSALPGMRGLGFVGSPFGKSSSGAFNPTPGSYSSSTPSGANAGVLPTGDAVRSMNLDLSRVLGGTGRTSFRTDLTAQPFDGSIGGTSRTAVPATNGSVINPKEIVPSNSSGQSMEIRKPNTDGGKTGLSLSERFKGTYTDIKSPTNTAGVREIKSQNPGIGTGVDAPPTTQPQGLGTYGIKDFAQETREAINKVGDARDPLGKDVDPNNPRPGPRGDRTPDRTPGTPVVGLGGVVEGATLETARQRMAEGKWTLAVDTFDRLLEKDAANRELLEGKAVCELAATFYVRADAHLRQIIAANPAYTIDLAKTLTPQRLEMVRQDLAQNLKQNPADSAVLFLSAFIARQTGDREVALKHLGTLAQSVPADAKFATDLAKAWYPPAR